MGNRGFGLSFYRHRLSSIVVLSLFSTLGCGIRNLAPRQVSMDSPTGHRSQLQFWPRCRKIR